MKRHLLFFALTLVSLTSYATGQEGDIIYIDGVQWELLEKPIQANSVLRSELRDALPEDRPVITSNWAGYTAYWSIQQEKLCLDSIKCMVSGGRTVCLSSDVLLRVFRKYVNGKRIVATWFDGDIRVAKGKVICYVHDVFERNYENERVISLHQGMVSGVKDYQNYVVAGFSFDQSRPRSNAELQFQANDKTELREKFPLQIEQYPELEGVKRIIFRVQRARVDAQGHLVDCELKVLKPGDNPRLAAEMAEAMKAYHPWCVYYINGEYRSYGIEGYTFPYILGE